MPQPGTAPGSVAFRLGYRPALDGLRAVAVVLVMLHHSAAFLWPSLFTTFATGGFLGVDVFFVLSGFLITVIVLAERERADEPGGPGRIPWLGRFYLRRVRRLVPALAVLLLFLVGCSVVFDTPTTSVLLRTIGWVLSYLGNWVMVSQPFAPEVSHTWSLSIEGQFYVVWPLVVLGVLALARPRRGSQVALASVIVAGIAAVVLWRSHVWGQQQNSLALYIRTPARLDALLVGCLAGLAAHAGWVRGRAVTAWRAALVAALVAVLVLAFTVEVTDGILYEGLLTVVAVLAATTVLGALFAGDDFVASRLLASRPFVAVGRWSYSLYLWHFPLFYLLGDHQPNWSPVARTAVGWLLTFAIATTSYRFVESPFLRRRPARTP